MTIDSAPINLTHHFLIAMPGLMDESFNRSVVYMCEHSDRGALGLIINKPSTLRMQDLFEKVELNLGRADLIEIPVFQGGPVHTERGFVLHEPPNLSATEARVSVDPSANPAASATASYSSSLTVPGGLTMTTSKDVLEAVAKGNGPKRFIMTLGYAGWGAGQLEEEIALNGWINAELSRAQMAEIIFNTPAEQRYQRAMQALGFDPADLSGQVGHA